MKHVIFVLLFILTTVSFSTTQEKIYTHSLNGVPKNLDPVSVESYYGSLIIASIYDTLYTYKYLKIPHEIKPALAESMPDISPDGLVYTIRLKKGIKFTDDTAFKGGKGREVIAEDFVYSIKRHMDPKNRSTSSSSFDNIAGLIEWKNSLDYKKPVSGLVAIDKYTVRITLKTVNPRFIYDLASTPASIVPKEAAEKYGREFAIHPVGSGPFKLISFNSTQAILKKNPTYREDILNLKEEGYDSTLHEKFNISSLDGKKMPFVDKIIMKFMKQSSSRWNSFNKGNEIQYAVIPSDQAKSLLASFSPPTLKKDLAKKFILKPEQELGLTFSTFNMANPEIGHNQDAKRNERNRALRCAIRKGFNWKARINRFYFGFGSAYSGAISPGLEGYSELPADAVTYDVQGAKKLLAQGRWTKKNLPTIIYGGTSSVTSRQLFEQFRGFMKKIGYPRKRIKFKVAPTFGDYIKAVNEGKYDYYGMGWVPSIPDPLQLMERYSSQHKSPGSNKAMFENKAFDQLFEEAKYLANGPARTRKLRQMNEILMKECVAIESYSRTNLHVWHKKVKMNYTGNMLRNIFKFVDVGTNSAH